MTSRFHPRGLLGLQVEQDLSSRRVQRGCAGNIDNSNEQRETGDCANEFPMAPSKVQISAQVKLPWAGSVSTWGILTPTFIGYDSVPRLSVGSIDRRGCGAETARPSPVQRRRPKAPGRSRSRPESVG